jgi:hypothetical protein
MRPLVTIALAAAAAAAAQAQTLEQRAAEVRGTLASPPPIETVIERGTAAINRAVTAAPAASPAAPAVQVLPAEAGLTNRLDARSPGPVSLDRPGGGALIGVPPAMSRHIAAPHVPGLVVHTTSGQAVSGASNLTTAPRSFAADGGNP